MTSHATSSRVRCELCSQCTPSEVSHCCTWSMPGRVRRELCSQCTPWEVSQCCTWSMPGGGVHCGHEPGSMFWRIRSHQRTWSDEKTFTVAVVVHSVCVPFYTNPWAQLDFSLWLSYSVALYKSVIQFTKLADRLTTPFLMLHSMQAKQVGSMPESYRDRSNGLVCVPACRILSTRTAAAF